MNKHGNNIDLPVIAPPNYLHMPSQWGLHNITILVNKLVAVSRQQHDELKVFSTSPEQKARL